MISHDTEGMMLITPDNNMCLTCHEPSIAKSMNIISVPKSHVTDYREGVSVTKDGTFVRDGKVLDNSSDIKLVSKSLSHVSNARFVCTACHAPQSDSKNVPENNFTADFRSKGLNEKSNFSDNFGEGVR
jgi:cytochrome c-type protein NapB